jgi:prepilin-type N-terminal cleavage/methylation domain-containing protein
MRVHRKGFTIIELLVVIVVLGILSAIALAKFASLKEQAYVAAMKADLRNLAVYQINYWESNGSFFSGDGTAQGFVPTFEVTVTSVVDPGPPTTWSATAAHANTPRTCAITDSLEITCS